MILFFLGFPFIYFDYPVEFNNQIVRFLPDFIRFIPFESHTINFIPDFIGYLMFFLGCIGIRKENSHITYVRILSVFLGAWSMVATAVQAIGVPIKPLFQTMIDIAASMLMLLMMYHFLEGIRFMQRSLERPIGASQLSYAWIALSAGKLIHYFSIIFRNQFFDPVFWAIEIVVFIVFEIALLYIFISLHRKPKKLPQPKNFFDPHR